MKSHQGNLFGATDIRNYENELLTDLRAFIISITDFENSITYFPINRVASA